MRAEGIARVVPFTIRSGLAEASIVGNFGGLILSLPATGFHDGILHFEGPLSSLTVTPNTTSGSQQLMAMARRSRSPSRGLLLYTRAWRGGFGGVDPVTYRFDAPFTILSGLDQATVSEDGTLLSVPGSDFHDGILFFGGPLTSLGVDTNSTSDAVHEMTLAVVPEAGAAAVDATASSASRDRG